MDSDSPLQSNAPVDGELPGYTRQTSVASRGTPTPASTVERVYSLEDRKGHKWVSLVVKSRSPNAMSPPLFLENDVITGRIELDLGKPETFKAIVVSVRAGTTAVGQEELVFLDINQELWTPSIGGKKTLSGRQSWPFSIELPRTVTIPDPNKQNKGSSLTTFPLPPTFSERASPAYIDYRLTVLIKRGALKVNQTLATNFGYQPICYPDPPSPLRQLSYVEGSALVGPDGDPEGWKVLPPIEVKGSLFDDRQVEATCTLAIAKPLCFALGGHVSLAMSITSPDSQALDILSTPLSIQLHLVRSIATGSDATGDEDLPRRSSNFFKESAGKALFWPSWHDGARVMDTRNLQGELQVSKMLKPSFVFPRFAVRYTLVLLPFQAVGFQSGCTGEPDALLSEKVTIVTAQTPGIKPRSLAPPGYIQQQGGDYDKAVGYLENGNQRFFQRHGVGVGLG